MTLASGTKLGPYEIVGALGAGGMGEVYRARDPRLGRDVAVKVLPHDVASDPERLARFDREAKTVAALNHPNIVVLHSIEEAGGTRFLTMELVEGQSLDRLVRPGGLPLSRVLDLAGALAAALVAAHERGVVHRDLKPANVMVTREWRVKVLDFGLAKPATTTHPRDATQADTIASPISSADRVVGTLPYMAPEQLRGKSADARTDLFALGIMLYELITGRRPFGGATAADVSSSILRDTPAPLSSLRADLPSDLDRIVGRCLEKDPERRVQTAKDVRNELELVRRALESGTTAAPRSSRAPVVAPPQDVPSIAVLPFANRSRDEEDEYFADGLADELLNVLAKVRGLRVAARSSSFQFKGKNEDPAVIGRKLNVATLLEGSVRKSGNRVRIAVQLVKVSDGFHLWSDTYDRTMEDIFAVQDDIAQSVVKELRTTLLGEMPDSKASGEVKAEVAQAAKGRGTDAEAHRLYLQGRYLVNRLTREDLAMGAEQLRRAVAADPGHALAWALLSWAETTQSGFGYTSLAESTPRARAAAMRALALEPDLAEGHLALGHIQHWKDFDWKGAEASHRRAMELAPGNADVLCSAGIVAHALGRSEEAVALCRRAIDQDPLSVTSYNFHGVACRGAGLLEEAEAAMRKALEISPESTFSHWILAAALEGQGRHDEALAEILREPEEVPRLYGEAILYHNDGRHAESDRALNELMEKNAGDAACQIAGAHAVRGEVDAAFEWLERAYVQRDPGLALMQLDPELRSLHRDPRWGAFLKKMGFPD